MKDNEEVHVAWISGITDSLKENIVKNNKEYIGKVAELTAMEIECIDNEYSLRHGKIVQWREDKTKDDCNFSQIYSE